MKESFVMSLVILLFAFQIVYGSISTDENSFNPDDILNKWETDALSSKVGDFLRSLPRYNFHFQKISNSWDPRNGEYYEGIGVLSAPLVAIGVLIFLFSLLAAFIKCCCLCSKKRESASKKSSIVCARIRFIFLGVILLAGSLVIMVANSSIHNATTKALNLIDTTAEDKVTYLQNVESVLSKLNESYSIAAQLQPFLQDANQTIEEYHVEKAVINKFEIDRLIGIYVLAGVACLITVFGIFSGFCSRPGAFCVSICCLLFAIFLWTLAGVHFFGALFVADACPNVENYIKNMTSDDSQSTLLIDYYLQCEGGNPMGTYIVTAMEDYNKTQTELTWAINHKEPPQVIDALQALLSEIQSLVTNLQGLSDCTTTKAAWLQVKQLICDSILDGLMLIVCSSLICAILYPMYICFGFQVHKKKGVIMHGDYVALSEFSETNIITTQPQPIPPQNPFVDLESPPSYQQATSFTYSNGSNFQKAM